MTVDDRARERFLKHRNLLVVLGPTASGKTGLAVRLARRMGGEIISADSRQVYRGMDLGTGKDLTEYVRNGAPVPFHLIDICDPEEEFSLFAFRSHFYRTMQDILGRRRVPLLAGGTGLYLDAVLRGYRMAAVPENPKLRAMLSDQPIESLHRRYRDSCPPAHNTTDLLDRARLIRAIEIADHSRTHPGETDTPIAVSPLVIGIRCERAELRRRITLRLQGRLESGMIEEVRRLHEQGVAWERLESFGLEYRCISLHLRQMMTREEMFETLNTRIHQFAKRQETWFRRMERDGVRIHWIDGADEEAAFARISDLTE